MAQAQTTPTPTLAPACDYLTGSIRGPFVDTGIDIDKLSKWGRVYLAEDTVGNFARMFGWIAPHDALVLADRAERAEADAAALRAKLDQYDGLRSALNTAGFAEAAPVAPGDAETASVGVDAANAPPEPHSEDEPVEFPQHRGGAYWDLSDGQTFRGSREEAEAAEQAVSA